MRTRCPCRTLEGNTCTRRLRDDYPFCSTHINQLLRVVGGSVFKWSRVMRTSFHAVDGKTVDDFLAQWVRDGHSLPPASGLKAHVGVVVKLIQHYQPLPVQALTEMVNRKLGSTYSSSQVGRCLRERILSGEVVRDATRSQKVTVHRTTVYRMGDEVVQIAAAPSKKRRERA